MSSPKHEIKTLQDILWAVNMDNVDNFLKDFDSFARMWAGTRGIVEAVGSAVELEQVIKDVKFTWIDDGKNEAKVTVEVREPKTAP